MDNFAQTPQGKSVEIKPMTVSIQVITVNNKQMTQAVFKQLPEKEYFDEEGYIIGNLWGRVTHEFGRYKDGFWIVFELDGVLYKNWNHKIISYIQNMVDKKKHIENVIAGSIKILLSPVYIEETPPSTNKFVHIGTERLRLKENPSHVLYEVTGINIDEDIFIDFSIEFSPRLDPLSRFCPLLVAEIPSIGWKKDILTFSDYNDLTFSDYSEQDILMRCRLSDVNYIYLNLDKKLFVGVQPDRKNYQSAKIFIVGLRDEIINLSVCMQIEERFRQLEKQTSLLPQLFIAV